MRILLAGGPLLLLLCLALTPAGASDQMDRRMTVTLARLPDTSPGTVTLEAILKNTSKGDVTIGVSDPLLDYELTVTGANRIPVPFSKRGKEFFSRDRIRSTRLIMATLGPGESRVDTWSINDLFELARPGQYLVTVKRRFRTGEVGRSVSSNVLKVKLTWKSGATRAPSPRAPADNS